MSFLQISDLLADGKKALDNGNYWSALSLALMLPSVCSRVEFAESKYEGKKKSVFDDSSPFYYVTVNGVQKWADRKAYLHWCKQYVFASNAYLRMIFGNDGPDILYMLRCDLFHAGDADLYYNKRRIYLAIGREDRGATSLDSRLIVHIVSLCNQLFEAVDLWLRNSQADSRKTTYVFDSANHDDRLLYNSLCEEDRLSYLREQFSAFEARRCDVKIDKEEQSNGNQ